jgi:hypothetical protein
VQHVLNKCWFKPIMHKHRPGLTSFLIGDLLGVVIRLDAVQELLSAFRMSNMFHPYIYTLLDVTIANNFVDDDTDSPWSNIVNDTSTTMVVLVGHAFLLSRICLDVNNVANTVVDEISGKFYRARFLE